jgi:hypothetical protein
VRIPNTWFAKIKGIIVVNASHYPNKREAAKSAIALRRTQKLPAKVVLRLQSKDSGGKPYLQ